MNATNNNTEYKKLPCLELLRFILAFFTMTWHYYYFGPTVGAIKLGSINLAGFRYFSFTVEVFFIISGFIIISSAINRKPIDFMIGRIVRLAPCLLICATITLAVGIILGGRTTIGNYLASILVLPLVYHKGVDWSYWSLQVELVFYCLIFALLYLIDVKRNIYKIALAIILYDALTFLVFDIFGSRSHFSEIIKYIGAGYATFFAIGILLYLVIVQKKINAAIISTLLAACLMGCIRCYQEANRIVQMLSLPHVNLFDGCLIFLSVFGIFICFVTAKGNPRFNTAYSRLGKASYPLYLIHQNIGYSVFDFFEKRFGQGFDARPIVMVAMVIVAAIIANLVEPALAAQYRKQLVSTVEFFRSAFLRTLKSKISDAE